MKQKEHFVITAIGIACALGRGRDEVLRNLKRADTSGMKELNGVLTAGDVTRFGFIPGWNATRPESLSADEFRVGAVADLAFSDIAEAVASAKSRYGRNRIGVVMGSSNSTMEEFTDNPTVIDMHFPARHLQEKADVAGPSLAVSTACSSSAKTFASARRLLNTGVCDAVIVGGADAFTRTVCEGFHSLEALSTTLCRPCSPNRDGINLGEGAALFLLERKSGSGHGIELLGIGESSDAYHLTAPDPEGRGAEAAMRAALEDADCSADNISFVNLHGTGTTYNDAMELSAVERVFGHCRVCAFSTKPLTGHCLGAAGAIEAALSSLALCERRGICLSNSFAFGGSNASIVLAG